MVVNLNHQNILKNTQSAKAIQFGGSNNLGYIPVTPEEALSWDYNTVINKLTQVTSSAVVRDLLDKTDRGMAIKGPFASKNDSNWINKTKIVAITPRVTKTYLGMVKYALTCPEETIHLLPLFENSGSVYSPVSWKLSDEFLDEELTQQGYDTPEKQFKFAVNAMHTLGKAVGFDAVPHMDRYAEPVFAYPEHFEWIKLNAEKTGQVPYSELDYNEIPNQVKASIVEYLFEERGDLSPEEINYLYDPETNEETRSSILFGDDPTLRIQRRVDLMNHLRKEGFETSHVVDPKSHHPYRPLMFDEMQTDGTNSWPVFKIKDVRDGREIKITRNGSLAPIKLYKQDPENGAMKLDEPNEAAIEYMGSKWADFQREFALDFLRADMAHIQISHDYGQDYPEKGEFWAKVKNYIQQQNQAPHFATFGETFFLDYLFFDPYQDMERKHFDTCLGYSHTCPVNAEFIHKVRELNQLQLEKGVNFQSCLPMLTNDQDTYQYRQNRDMFTDAANKVKAFVGLFMNQPSYMSIGFETLDQNAREDRDFTRFFTWSGVREKYNFGQNFDFFDAFTGMRKKYVELKQTLTSKDHYWLNTRAEGTGAWMYYDGVTRTPTHLFAINTDLTYTKDEVEMDNPFEEIGADSDDTFALDPVYSTERYPQELAANIFTKRGPIKITNMAPGEGRIYRIVQTQN